MLEIYSVGFVILCFFWAIAFLISAGYFVAEKFENSYRADHAKNAKVALAIFASIILIAIWPLTLLGAVVYLFIWLAKEAFPSGLHNNELN